MINGIISRNNAELLSLRYINVGVNYSEDAVLAPRLDPPGCVYCSTRTEHQQCPVILTNILSSYFFSIY